MINIKEENIMKLTITGKWDDDKDGEKDQAESYAKKYGYDFTVYPADGGKFCLEGSKVML